MFDVVKKCTILFSVLALGSLALSAYGQAPVGKETSATWEYLQFMPDNDLGTQDAEFGANVSNISQDQFNSIIDAAYKIYAPFAAQRQETLQINKNWDDTTVNANCSRNSGRVTVNMYGGLARRSEVTPEGFALVLCHELGHAYGGEPYVRPAVQMAAEGQADYYGAGTCLKALLPDVDDSNIDADSYMQDRCQQNSGDYTLCVRQMQAGLSLGGLLAAVKHEATLPSYQTPDLTVVEQTLLTYPKTIQCRVDTYHNAILGLDRPACWYKN